LATHGTLGSWFGPEVALRWLFPYPHITRRAPFPVVPHTHARAHARTYRYTVVHHYRYTRVHHFRYEHVDDSTPFAPR
jgi:hypothetical protein